MICVVAHDLNDFRMWCVERGLDPRDQRSVRFINEPHKLRGLRDVELVYTAKFWHLPWPRIRVMLDMVSHRRMSGAIVEKGSASR